MATTFTNGSSLQIPATGDISQKLQDIGALRNLNKPKLTDEDCPLGFALTEWQCFGYGGLDNLIDNRNPVHLNSGLSAGLDGVEMGVLGATLDNQRLESLEVGFFLLAKVKYIAPCSINGVQFNIPIANGIPLAIFSSLDGAQGAAHNQLLTWFRQDLALSEQNIHFGPSQLGAQAPSAANDSAFCWILIGIADSKDVPCPQPNDTMGVANLIVTKPEFSRGNLNAAQVSVAHGIANPDSPNPGPTNLAEWVAALFVICGTLGIGANEIGLEPIANGFDMSGDGLGNIVDIVAAATLLQMILDGQVDDVDLDNLPPVVPALCCDETDVDIPKPDPEPIKCHAEMEIMAVLCRPAVPQTAEDKLAADSGSPAGSTSKRADDCDDDEVLTPGRMDMVILVGIRNDLSASGFQFDIGFNKLSAVPLENIEVQLASQFAIENNWNIAHLPYEDRYGYDRGVRVISTQPLLSAQGDDGTKTYGFDATNDEEVTGLQTLASLPPSGNSFQPVAMVTVRGVPQTVCPCPERAFRIVGSLESLPRTNEDQRRYPELYATGAEWKGATVYNSGQYWTAQVPRSGRPIRDETSLPLMIYWKGIGINNKRVISNEYTYRPRHEQFGLSYVGETLGLQAFVPANYNNFLDYFNFVLNIWIYKALYNGLNLDLRGNLKVSRYDFMWEAMFQAMLLSLQNVAGGNFTPEQIQNLLSNFDKGFADDATLDGKFDVADIVALINSAQFRLMLPITAADIANGSWRNVPTSWSGASTSSSASSAGDVTSGWSQGSFNPEKNPNKTPTTRQDIPNLGKIVPIYCLDTICTSTMSDLCPDICGNDLPESPETLTRNVKKYVLSGFSQRMDILPDKAATLELAFYNTPQAGTEIKFKGFRDGEIITETVRFVATGSNGAELLPGVYSIVAPNKATAISNLNSYFNSMSSTGITSSVTGSKILLTQPDVGRGGNTLVGYSDVNALKLKTFKTSFTGGSRYFTNLPQYFRNWSEYFNSIHNIEYESLYYNEEEYGSSGASFFELQTRISPVQKLTRQMGYISHVINTLDFCHAYESTDSPPKVKILPGDGFYRADVYDYETGAIMTPNAADPFANFYTVPTHGKIVIVSHNYRAQDGVFSGDEDSTTENSDYYAPITQDGGKLVTAKVFVTPMPKWDEGKYIEILDGASSTFGTPDGLLVSSAHPIGDTMHGVKTGKNMIVGPKTSQFSQNYHDDSASLHTYADYMLHAQLMAPNIVRVRYNTMRPFKYAKFAIKTHNRAEIEKVELVTNAFDPQSPSVGWTVRHHFNQNVADTSGLPLDPSGYEGDGFSVVTIEPTGTYTDDSNVVHYGHSVPETFNGQGALCDIYFKKNLFDEFPIPQKLYICPPIGSNNYSLPARSFDAQAESIQQNHTGIEKSYPEGSDADKKYQSRDEDKVLLINFDASYNTETKDPTQIVKSTSSGNEFVDRWISTPGTQALPHNGNNAHRPQFSILSGDTRNSVAFTGGQGLSTPASGAGYRFGKIHDWSLYATINATDTLNSSVSSGGEAVIFRGGGSPQSNQMRLTLKLVKGSGANDWSLTAVSEGNNGAGQSTVATLSHNFTVTGTGADRTSDLHGWHTISWVGDSTNKKGYLYIDGKVVAEATLAHSTKLAKHGLQWFIGHDGTQSTISATVGNASGGSPFAGRIHQIMLYQEAQDTNNREIAEAYLGVKYSLDTKLDTGHRFYNDGNYKQLTARGYLELNRTDRAIDEKITSKLESASASLDLGSDRCAAAWVSDHICLDKYAQTLLSVKCEGTGDEYLLGG